MNSCTVGDGHVAVPIVVSPYREQNLHLRLVDDLGIP